MIAAAWVFAALAVLAVIACALARRGEGCE